MLATSEHMVVLENQLSVNRIIEPGALELPKDRVTVQWNMNYEQAPMGFARLFERKGDEIWATIDWITDQYKAFFDADGTFSKDWFELSAYATDIKLDSDDDGNFIVKHGVIRAICVIPFQGIPRGIVPNAQDQKEEV